MKEKEDITLVVSKEFTIQNKLSFEKLFSWISFVVNSSLMAVGSRAAFSKALAENGISCKIIAGFHNDHIFVPLEDSSLAMQVLRSFKSL